jgi:hypothetical protein
VPQILSDDRTEFEGNKGLAAASEDDVAADTEEAGVVGNVPKSISAGRRRIDRASIQSPEVLTGADPKETQQNVMNEYKLRIYSRFGGSEYYYYRKKQ